MGIRTTVTLEEDVLERVRLESRARGASFRDTLNDLLRTAFIAVETKPPRGTFRVEPLDLGYYPGLNYDDIEGLIEFAEGPWHR